MRKRKEELVSEFSKPVLRLTSVLLIQSAGVPESSDCIGNSKNVRTYSSQHISVETLYASIGRQTKNISVKHIHEGESYIKSHLINENKITKVEQIPTHVNKIQQKFNIQADNAKYTDDIEEKYVFSVDENNTVSPPC